MEMSKDAATSLPFSGGKSVSDMSLVEIAEQLEKVTTWIEAQRSKERDARNAYQTVAQQVEANIKEIRKYGQQLYDHQRKKLTSFEGLLGNKPDPQQHGGSRSGRSSGSSNGAATKLNIAQAILEVWNLEKYREPLTTEDITSALPDVGYKSSAAPSSLKSSINQALAKLCRQGKVVRYRSDGSRIPQRDTKSRARKYMSAAHAPTEGH